MIPALGVELRAGKLLFQFYTQIKCKSIMLYYANKVCHVFEHRNGSFPIISALLQGRKLKVKGKVPQFFSFHQISYGMVW